MRRKSVPRNKNGLVERTCDQCGKMRYSKRIIIHALCKSCGIKKSFRSRPAVGLKTISNMDQVIKEYQSGRSLQSLGKQYGVSAMTIRTKIITNGSKTRNYSESSKLTRTIFKAHAKIKELCETGEFQRNRSAMLQGIPVKEWKGFITPENKRLVASPEYRKWQKSVFNRDNHTCQLCGKTKCPIAAHHIYMKAKYPDKVLDVDNGITLCDKCHHKTIGHEDEYIDIFLGVLCGKKQLD